jgi:CBS domain-containing protein
VWVAVGSQARRELTPASVARGALICNEPPPEGWIEDVQAALGRCGLPGTVIARSGPGWEAADVEDELTLSVLVERRALWGTPRDPLPVVEGRALEEVLAELARRALAYTPPTGFDADSVLESDGTRSDRLDIRRAAVIPIVELARWAGAGAGMHEGTTAERLLAGAEAGVLSVADARTLSDAFELALELRIAHHMQQLSSGGRPDDQLEPAALSPLMRDQLRDVFRAVSGVQRGLRT